MLNRGGKLIKVSRGGAKCPTGGRIILQRAYDRDVDEMTISQGRRGK